MTLVCDASALLALLLGEPGADRMAELLGEAQAVIGAVNACEVSSKLAERGMDEASILATWAALPIDIAPLSAEQAHRAALLRPVTRHLGLSLGDRACLALAQHTQDATVVTADPAWQAIKGFRFTFIR
ncbi:MAG: type II toxin-antitoxin system VapC family toxin [Proteobacteria bacterium]|nr:type II toxin-antitoxin system VapC family toxin [Pseudomonadota bacterium]